MEKITNIKGLVEKTWLKSPEFNFDLSVFVPPPKSKLAPLCYRLLQKMVRNLSGHVCFILFILRLHSCLIRVNWTDQGPCKAELIMFNCVGFEQCAISCVEVWNFKPFSLLMAPPFFISLSFLFSMISLFASSPIFSFLSFLISTFLCFPSSPLILIFPSIFPVFVPCFLYFFLLFSPTPCLLLSIFTIFSYSCLPSFFLCFIPSFCLNFFLSFQFFTSFLFASLFGFSFSFPSSFLSVLSFFLIFLNSLVN